MRMKTAVVVAAEGNWPTWEFFQLFKSEIVNGRVGSLVRQPTLVNFPISPPQSPPASQGSTLWVLAYFFRKMTAIEHDLSVKKVILYPYSFFVEGIRTWNLLVKGPTGHHFVFTWASLQRYFFVNAWPMRVVVTFNENLFWRCQNRSPLDALKQIIAWQCDSLAVFERSSYKSSLN